MTKKTRPTYAPEFRLESAQLVFEQGYSIREAAEVMNVSKGSIEIWVRKLRNKQKGVLSQWTLLTAEPLALTEVKLEKSNE